MVTRRNRVKLEDGELGRNPPVAADTVPLAQKSNGLDRYREESRDKAQV